MPPRKSIYLVSTHRRSAREAIAHDVCSSRSEPSSLHLSFDSDTFHISTNTTIRDARKTWHALVSPLNLLAGYRIKLCSVDSISYVVTAID